MCNGHLRHSAALLTVIALFAATLLAPVRTAAQRSAIDTYAITNARIVTVAGPTLERATVVIRDGLIEAVGTQVRPPADARVIDGTGLTVYPGLIDANTALGMPAPTPSPSPAGRGSGGPFFVTSAPAFSSPNSSHPLGLQPEILAADIIRPGGGAIEAARNAGLTAALTAPREGIFIGQSALINLAGDTPQAMLVRSPVALHIGFTPLRTGSYPGSLMGVFSSIRQMLLDAARYREANEIYERHPKGLRRPEQDKSLAALQPVLAREMPVVMYANTEREIGRALDLAQEFNLRAIIAGGAEAWKLTDRLRASGVPVLLSLNFPRRTTAAVPEADPEPLRILRGRVDAPKTAGRLVAAGVPIAFESGGMANMTDFLANAVKSVDNGLSRDEALRAMTIRPAEIFGVADRLGTIEVGKIANLTVTRGDLFDRRPRISYLFIDGRPVDLRPVTATPAVVPGAAGRWALRIQIEGEGEKSITLVLQQEGERLGGSISGELGSTQIADASVGVSGDIRFTAPVQFGGQTTEAAFTGTINNNEMSGTVQIVGRGPATFTGTRQAATPPAPARTPPRPTPSPTPSSPAPPTATADDNHPMNGFTGGQR